MVNNIIKLTLLLVLTLILVCLVWPKLAILLNNWGVKFYNEGSYNNAIALLKWSLRIKPSVDTYYNMASVFMQKKMGDEAIKQYKEALRLSPRYLNAYKDLAWAYSNKKRYRQAIDLLKQAEKIDSSGRVIKELSKTISSNYANDSFNKGVISLLSDDKKSAYIYLRKATEIRPGFPRFHYVLGYCYYSDRDFDKAEIELEKTIQADTQCWQANKLLGDIFFERGDYQGAISRYKKALVINYDDAELYNDVGLALVELEDYPGAIEYLLDALRLKPDNPNIIYNLATVYRDAEMHEKAISEYERLAYIKPNYPGMHNNLGDIYTDIGKIEEASEQYRNEIAYSQLRLSEIPDDVVALHNLARAHNGLKEYDKAKAFAIKAVELAPDYRDAYLILAKIKENLEEHQQALDALNKARSLSHQPGFIDRDIVRLEKESKIAVDKIYLKNGRVIEGAIKDEAGGKIVLEVNVGNSWGTVSLTEKDIARIERFRSSSEK